MALDTIIDNLCDGYKQLVPGTFQHVDQLMNERRTNEELRNYWFYTADGELYVLNGKKKTPTLAITREADNLVLRHIDDAFKQLTQNGNYHLNPEEAQKAIDAENTVVIDLTTLRLSGDDNEWSYLPIKTTELNTLNEEELKLIQRVYGQGNDLFDNMQMLANAGIRETRVYVLNPAYVQKEAQDGPIGRASWLNNFDNNSNFIANDRIVIRGRLRGVLRTKK